MNTVRVNFALSYDKFQHVYISERISVEMYLMVQFSSNYHMTHVSQFYLTIYTGTADLMARTSSS
jgi:hypothetical protein